MYLSIFVHLQLYMCLLSSCTSHSKFALNGQGNLVHQMQVLCRMSQSINNLQLLRSNQLRLFCFEQKDVHFSFPLSSRRQRCSLLLLLQRLWLPLLYGFSLRCVLVYYTYCYLFFFSASVLNKCNILQALSLLFVLFCRLWPLPKNGSRACRRVVFLPGKGLLSLKAGKVGPALWGANWICRHCQANS